MTEQRDATLTPNERAQKIAAASAVTLSIASAAWVASLRQMRGMNMGPATDLGSFGDFTGLWLSMMAAMMLPGAAAALVGHVPARRVRPLPFVAAYLAVWVAVGVVAYVLYRPHGSAAAGTLVLAAGLYEFTPVKRAARRRCRDSISSGFRFGFSCLGSSIGLMLILLAVGVMSVVWMVIVSAVVTAQKILPVRAAGDLSLAVVIVGWGVWILVAPSTVPGLLPSM